MPSLSRPDHISCPKTHDRPTIVVDPIQMNIDHESEQVKKVFAWFGLTMYQAQCLERQLAIVLATKYGPGPTRISREDFDHILEGLFSRTLGQLVSEVGRLAGLSRDEHERLQTALIKRNWLAHNYFWERAVQFTSESGRASMIEELQETGNSFVTLDALFTQKTIEWGETVGITEQFIDEELEKLLSNWERDDEFGRSSDSMDRSA